MKYRKKYKSLVTLISDSDKTVTKAARDLFKTLNNVGPNSLKTIYFKKGSFKPQSSWQFKFDTFSKAQYKQYEEKLYVR